MNGNRVELGDVESALRASPLVASAAARVIDGRLCGYCVLRPAAASQLEGEGSAHGVEATDDGPQAGITPPELAVRYHAGASLAVRLAAQRLLPAAVVPGRLAFVSALPLTPTGKVARQRLPALAGVRDEAGGRRHGRLTRAEALLWPMWAEAVGLGADDGALSVTDNFFALGGESGLKTSAVQLMAGLSSDANRVDCSAARAGDAHARLQSHRLVQATLCR